MDTFSNDWARVRAGRLEAEPAADAVPRACATRSSASFVDRNDIYANFVPTDGGHHVVPNAAIARAAAARRRAAGPHADARTRSMSAAALIKTDRNNFSPRVGFAQRLDNDNKTVLRGGFGIFHPTGAAQGARDIMSRNPFRYTITFTAAASCSTASPPARGVESLGFGNQGLAARSRELRTSISTTSRSSASCPAASAPASATSARRCASCWCTATTTRCRRAPCRSATWTTDPAAQGAAAVPDLRHVHGHHREHAAKGQFNALQLELQRRFKSGLRGQRRLHARRLRQQRARQRQQHDRRRAVRSRTTSRRIAGRIRTS